MIKNRAGHTIFEYNVVTKQIAKAKFENPEPSLVLVRATQQNGLSKSFSNGMAFVLKPEKYGRLIVRKDCIYGTALNLKNFKRKLYEGKYL